MTDRVVTAEIDIDASPERVWQALTDPSEVKQYMFGTDLVTDWRPGSPIVWRGEWEGRRYEDKGVVVAAEPRRMLRVTHFSPLSGAEDRPENYHTLIYRLSPAGGGTHLTLSQDNNRTEDEAEHSRANWETMLQGMKEHVESA